jgi:hypothetical protein
MASATFGQVGADDPGRLDQGVENLAGASDEGGGAASPGRARHVPGVGGNQPHLVDGHPEPLGRHPVRPHGAS